MFLAVFFSTETFRFDCFLIDSSNYFYFLLLLPPCCHDDWCRLITSSVYTLLFVMRQCFLRRGVGGAGRALPSRFTWMNVKFTDKGFVLKRTPDLWPLRRLVHISWDLQTSRLQKYSVSQQMSVSGNEGRLLEEYCLSSLTHITYRALINIIYVRVREILGRRGRSCESAARLALFYLFSSRRAEGPVKNFASFVETVCRPETKRHQKQLYSPA